MRERISVVLADKRRFRNASYTVIEKGVEGLVISSDMCVLVFPPIYIVLALLWLLLRGHADWSVGVV